MQALTPGPDDAVFDVDEFIRSGKDTLYMISRGKKNSAAPMVNALMVEVLHRADILSQHPTDTDLAHHAHGDLRLDPPMRVVMDEASNITPLEDLAARLADSGGRGIQLYVYIQSHSQLRQRWGVEGAVEIWDNAAIKLILGGLSNAKDLRDISELLGDRHLDQASVSTGASHNVTVSTRTERALAVDAIRELGDGEALLLYRNMRAAKVHLPGTWEVPDIDKQVTISRREARQLIATARRADRTTQREQSMFTLEGVDGKRNPQ
jgi:type IV secretory pathway TraG/TraD family ATPase VirD4